MTTNWTSPNTLAQYAETSGNTNKWNTNLTMTDIQNSLFGVIIRFQSYTDWPYKSSPLIEAVRLRIH